MACTHHQPTPFSETRRSHCAVRRMAVQSPGVAAAFWGMREQRSHKVCGGPAVRIRRRHSGDAALPSLIAASPRLRGIAGLAPAGKSSRLLFARPCGRYLSQLGRSLAFYGAPPSLADRYPVNNGNAVAGEATGSQPSPPALFKRSISAPRRGMSFRSSLRYSHWLIEFSPPWNSSSAAPRRQTSLFAYEVMAAAVSRHRRNPIQNREAVMNAIDGPSSGRAAPREPVASSERRLEAASSSCAGSWAPRISFAGECRFLDLKAIRDAGHRCCEGECDPKVASLGNFGAERAGSHWTMNPGDRRPALPSPRFRSSSG